jgi:hypothetical protein
MGPRGAIAASSAGAVVVPIADGGAIQRAPLVEPDALDDMASDVTSTLVNSGISLSLVPQDIKKSPSGTPAGLLSS